MSMTTSDVASLGESLAGFVLDEPSRFSRTGLETYDQNTPLQPYLTFNIGPGQLKHLTIKIWSCDQGKKLGWCNQEFQSDDLYANSHTLFALGLIKDQDSSPDLFAFLRNKRADDLPQCHISEWKLGVAAEEDDRSTALYAWLESLTPTTDIIEIGIFPLAYFPGWTNYVWDIQVWVHSISNELPLPAGRQIGWQLGGGPRQTVLRQTSRHLKTRRILRSEDWITEEPPDGPETFIESFYECPTTGTIGDVEEVMFLNRDVLNKIPLDNPVRVQFLRNIRNCLSTRFKRADMIEDAKEAISIGREIIAALPGDNPSLSECLNSVGTDLYNYYSRTDAVDYLEEAIRITRQAVATSPLDDVYRPETLSHLGQLLGQLFSRKGTIEDLDESISVSRQSIATTPLDDSDRPRRLDKICNLLGQRFLSTGAMEDLEEAISLTRQAIAVLPLDHPDRLASLGNLANRLNWRFSRTNAIQDIDEAISLSRHAIAAVPLDHAMRARYLVNFANHLYDRFSSTDRVEDLEEAVSVARQSLTATPADHPDRSVGLSNLGLLLSDRFTRTGRMEDIEEAISLCRKAIATTAFNHPNRFSWLNNLAVHLDRRFSRTGAMEDCNESIECLQSALRSEISPIGIRIMAGRGLLSRSRLLQRGGESCNDAQLAVSLIPLSVSTTLSASDKRHIVYEAVGISSDAAAIALHFGQGALAAMQLLETGRGILISSISDIRTDLSDLREQHPQLAKSFEELKSCLSTTTSSSSSSNNQLDSSKVSAVSSSNYDSRYEAGRRLPLLLKEIRTKSGFERFLLPPTEEDLCRAAEAGPIITLNVSSHRCDALIIEGSGIRAIPLPRLSKADILARLGNVRSVETLQWLWDVVVGPVLSSLGFAGDQPATASSWPHVWWIATGPLSKFPLHAAGYHMATENNNTAVDRVISSYSSSVKTIIRSRHLAGKDQHYEAKSSATVALASMKETPGQSSLIHAADEISAVRALCTLSPLNLTAVSPRPIRSDVLAALATCNIFHFAGHGSTDSDPLRSRLFLEDWEEHPLIVADLIETDLSSNFPFLAYLSACDTGQNPENETADEGIHLASALHLAGFRHVIGTLWEVDDSLCVDVAKLFYRSLSENGLNDGSVSSGLHLAVRSLRDEWM
ncbi:hypothetical protein CP533_5265 [Ophiocordyceps camponoti-saundersi (nom. inval.)]|nr:hypothetical protein CP533_5265 [Ophiocordyceps camponoti-saundersi (nom. inval.)]